MKYALKVKLGEGDWIYVTEDTRHCWDLRPLLFETFEQANQAAQVWRIQGKSDAVTVVEYLDE